MAAKKPEEKEAQGGAPETSEATGAAPVLEDTETRPDETVPGGRYVVNGIVVNADGDRIE